jgi:probable rRNA maturation factor
MPVQFFFLTKKISLTNRRKLKIFIECIFTNEKKKLQSLAYIFCSDEYLLKVNQDFLNHNFYTDIVTFDLSSEKGMIRGEIYISIDRVRDNSKMFSTTINNELHRVIFHGALHLCGYRDKKKSEIALMRAMENKYLELYFK